MIKQLKEFYWDNLEYAVLTTSRTISIYKNQEYFNEHINLLSFKDFIKLVFSFKKYDIVIDTEDYFNISSLLSLWLWKINIWFSPIFSRRIAYNNSIEYDDKKHACLWFLDLLIPLGIRIKTPDYLEIFKYREKDKLKVNDFLKKYEWYKKLCFHTWWAETNNDRFWDKQNWIKLINMLKDENIVIFLSWTRFEEKWVLEIISEINNEKVVNICNRFNLSEFAYFLKNCDLVVSNDTWPMHLSASMKTKTIWLFWPNLPDRFWAYPLDKNINLYKWNYKPTINVHLWDFRTDKNNFVNKIRADEIYEIIKKEIS